MNIETQLQKIHSVEVTHQIVDWVGNNLDRIHELIQLVEQEDFTLSQRASWPLTYVVENYPEICAQFQKRFIALLKDASKHEAIRRNIMRAFTFMEIQDEFESALFDLAFEWLSSSNTTVAVKVHSMQVMYNLSIKYPELQNELLEELNRQQPFQTDGFNSRAQKLKVKIMRNIRL